MWPPEGRPEFVLRVSCHSCADRNPGSHFLPDFKTLWTLLTFRQLVLCCLLRFPYFFFRVFLQIESVVDKEYSLEMIYLMLEDVSNEP